jgi:dienelactone hydrolase
MYEYFPNSYPWNMAFLSALDMGAVLSEVDAECRPLQQITGEDPEKAIAAWSDAWERLGRRLDRQARRDEAEAHGLSAGEKYLRSALYLLIAERQLSASDPRKLELYRRALPLFRRGVELRRDPTEFVEIPYDGGCMPALLVRPPGDEPAPCIIHWNGLDSIKEFAYLQFAEAYARRGIASLFCDQPGSGGALRLHGLPATVETEGPAGVCVDWLETRDDVDPSRIGIQALSLGGYFAPRAAAFEPRLACCVVLGAFYSALEVAQMMQERGDAYARSVSDFEGQLRWVTGSDTLEQAMQFMARVTLEKVAEHIRCPLLIVHGGQDRQIPPDHGRKTIDAARQSPQRKLVLLDSEEGGVEHCSHDNRPLACAIMADWIADTLGADPSGRASPGFSSRGGV